MVNIGVCVGAAGFTLGLSLAGLCVAGAASADSTTTDSARTDAAAVSSAGPRGRFAEGHEAGRAGWRGGQAECHHGEACRDRQGNPTDRSCRGWVGCRRC